ncbi:DUF6143 family protein [Mechercharimyces sp. CAU 1602]|uniref:DUF6143 family protein n=1 Tax=Mechercharimyces sp. CAU 1602 TaxID=2973933 RepID=UPI0021625E7A|nr:DUF6143 family protein [Mechercharimyces sp. CAU 1602]
MEVDSIIIGKSLASVVEVTQSAFRASRGNLFIGTTGTLLFGEGRFAWGRLFNPLGSNRNLTVQLFSIANFSPTPCTARLFLNPFPPGKVFTSPLTGNLKLNSTNIPVGKVQFSSFVTRIPVGGSLVALRRVPPNNTFDISLEGNVLITPGKSFLFFLINQSLTRASVEFVWWESPISSKL